MIGALRKGAFALLVFLGSCLCWPRLAHAVPWVPFGPDGGDARRIVADPRDHSHFYLGAANGWIYESHNGGASWLRLAQIGKRDDLVLDSILIDPSDPKHLVVGAWVLDRPDGGLFLSTDGGATWTNQAEMRGQSVRSLALSPSNPQVMVAGSLQGIFRSADGGRRWTRISPAESSEIHEIQSVAIDPKDPATIYAGTWHLPWKTTDGGEHWTSIKQGVIDDSDVFSIIVDPQTPATVYASACSGIYKSDDGGGLFHKIQGIPSTARRTRVLLQDPQHLETVFAGTTEGLFRTDDAGKTWSRITGPEVIVNDVSVDLSDSKHVLIATNRGGVLSSKDGGDSFRSSNQGFSARQITSLKRDSRHPASLFAGVVNDKEWGGVFQSDNGGVNWVQRSEGLQAQDVFALGQAPDGTMIAGTGHGIFRFDFAAGTWKQVEQATPQGAREVKATPPAAPAVRPPVQIARNQFAAAKRHQGKKSVVRRSPGKAKKGSARSVASAAKPRAKSVPAKPTRATAHAVTTKSAPAKPAAAGGPAEDAVVVPAKSASYDVAVYSFATAGERMIAASTSGLIVSKDNGQTWDPVGGLSGEWRVLASAKQNVVAASLHQAIFSPDAGQNWSPVQIPADLTLVSAIAVEPSGKIWVGGREGLFTSPDAGNTWSKPEGIYAGPVSSLFFEEGADRLTVSIAGPRGVVFTLQLPQRSVAYYESGWSIRLARPLGDHLVAATLFDGLVIQPRMMAAPSAESEVKRDRPSASAVDKVRSSAGPPD